VRRRLDPDRARALASLWEKAGTAIDLATSLKERPDDPRNAWAAGLLTSAQLDEILTAAHEVNDLIGAHNLEGATNAARPLERLLRKVDELYLVPLVNKARSAKRAEAKAVEQTHGTEDERLARQERRRALFLAERGRGVPKMKAYDNVAKTEGVSRKTVARAVASKE
jgi:hypothetical protein